jgi:uncharacterized RDD family membrane protein YckC
LSCGPLKREDLAKLIVNPTSTNRREIALARALVSIGRDPSNDLVLPDAMVSRRHAVIECRGSQYYLRDCNSSNGSVINGDRVSERRLRDGDLVAIGSARLLFREEREESGAKIVPHPSAPRLVCPACHGDYRKGDVFCRECGEKLPEPSGPPKAVCASCGTAVPLPARYCCACGALLPRDEQPVEALKSPPAESEGQRGEPAEASPVPPQKATATSTSGALAESPLPRPVVLTEPAPPLASRPVAVPRAEPSPRSQPGETGPRTERPAAFAAPATGPRPVSASTAARALAGLIDLGLVGLVDAVLVLAPLSYWRSQGLPPPPLGGPFPQIAGSLVLGALSLAVGIGYFAYFWGVRGASPGKRMLDLQVEGDDGRAPIGLARASARAFGYLLSGAILGIGFLMIPLTGSGLHDRLAGTRVVVRRGRD